MANTKISHNGEVIAEVNGGQTATLKCAGTQMLGDVVVDVAETKLQAKTATENGEVTPDEGYAGLSKVTVDVPIPDGYIVPSDTKDVTENGEHDVTEFATVNVDVPVPDGYIQPSGTLTITENGTHDVSGYESAEVAVESSGGGGFVLPAVKPKITLPTNILMGSITVELAVDVSNITDLAVTKGE